MARRPPDLRGQIVARLAERLDRGGEQQSFADGGDLGLEAALIGLIPEGSEVRRYDDAGYDLAIGLLEGPDLCAEIVGKILVAAGVDELVAELVERRREAD